MAEAERVLGAPLPAIAHFAEEQSAELRDRIFDEFNSLAVLLRAPAATFVQAARPVEPGAAADEDDGHAAAGLVSPESSACPVQLVPLSVTGTVRCLPSG